MFRLSSLSIVFSALFVAVTAWADEFPQPYNSEPAKFGEPLPPEKAAATMRVPAGFQVNVFAAEPNVRNPIALSWDPRGRLWIAENFTYAERPKKFELALRDRIVILPDADGDGRAEQPIVFADDIQALTSIEWSAEGVWAMCPPQLMFIPDRNRDDRPDGPAQVILDGFTIPAESFHNFANGLRWGPDGWLYGRCGASAPGKIGAPGTPVEQRVPLNGGVWRYHPTRKAFEPLCHGTTNPWGHDWNAHGEGFFINTVNGHLWHLIPGAHFVRPHTIDPNPRVYEAIDMHADHWHWDTGKTWADSRSATGEHDRLGGGHSHIGAMVYLGDQWPAEYRGRLFTLNQHGRRVNDEQLERKGSGYVAHHNPDMIFSADPFFRGIDLTYGPDGSVFILDWSDAGECHDADGVHRTSGRIFRVTYGTPAAKPPMDVSKRDAAELVALHKHKNEWFARQARLELRARAASGDELDLGGAMAALEKIAREDTDSANRVRAVCTLHALDRGLPLETLLRDKDEHVRTWGVRLALDTMPIDTIFGPGPNVAKNIELKPLVPLVELASADDSGLVKLALASALQRLPVNYRWQLALTLAKDSAFAEDHNLPAMVWFGLIPVADAHPEQVVTVAAFAKWPKLRQWIARRLSEDQSKRPEPLNLLLSAAVDIHPDFLADALAGMTDGLAGLHKAPKPASWEKVQAAVEKTGDEHQRELLRDLSVLFGDGRALDEVRKIALDGKADLNQRRVALETLIQSKPPELREICEQLLGVRFLNSVAARGLALFNDPKIGVKLAKSYRSFHQSERGAVMETLVSRPTFAAAMLDEMAAGKIAPADLSAFQARQIRSFNDAKLGKRLVEVWGEIRDSSADKQALMSKLRETLTDERLAKADAGQGRVVFNALCANCHRLYGHGGEIGPDLTGAGRQNLEYVITNIVDPSAVVTADFRMSVVLMNDGRVLNGIIRAQNERTITLQTAKERVTVDREDIDTMEQSQLSLMPEGQLQPLSDEQVANLVAYLMTRTQVPLPEGAAAPSAAAAAETK
ncbi:MAG: c-type cytochrome [Planctomycetes bacterium]|nr:c-type cytochrome [Planctomycetota bacterium]